MNFSQLIFKMIILGIMDGQHDSGACILKDGEIISSINEERITRKKMQGGFPKKSIDYVLKESKVKPQEINAIVFGSILTPPIFARLFRNLQNEEDIVRSQERNKLFNLLSDIIQYKIKLTLIKPNSLFGRFNQLFLKLIISRYLGSKFKGKKIYFVDHHLSHAASAHYTTGNDENLVITGDCWGDGT